MRRWLPPLLAAMLGLILLWAYAARPISNAGPAASPAPSAVKAAPSSPPTSRSAEASASATAQLGVPLQLSLLSQRSSAPVVSTGLEADGSMHVPRDPGTVGWYSRGARPGATRGSMVMAGHVNSRSQGKGLLAGLRKTKIGDVILVRVPDGRGYAYRITHIRDYHKQVLPLANIFADDVPHRLTLIRCSGRFLGQQMGYEDNLVVTATPVS